MRLSAVYIINNELLVFYSNVKDCPEHILLSKMDLNDNWLNWKPSEPLSVIKPELDYEGVKLPLEPSERGNSDLPVRQLRDPAVYEEDDKIYLLYSVAGEQGIAICEITIKM